MITSLERTKDTTVAEQKIFLVDDHPLFREGVVHLIENQPDLVVCGTSASGREAVEKLADCEPDLLLLDMNLPDRNGLEVIKDLKNLKPNLPVLILSMHDESLYAERSIRAGAKGYMMKDSGGEELIGAVYKVLKGELAVSERIASRLSEGGRGRRGSSDKLDVGRLTDRELQIFQLVGKGLNSHEIGNQLSISNRTVDAHRTNIKDKLGLADAVALTRYAVWWVEMGENSQA